MQLLYRMAQLKPRGLQEQEHRRGPLRVQRTPGQALVVLLPIDSSSFDWLLLALFRLASALRCLSILGLEPCSIDPVSLEPSPIAGCCPQHHRFPEKRHRYLKTDWKSQP